MMQQKNKIIFPVFWVILLVMTVIVGFAQGKKAEETVLINTQAQAADLMGLYEPGETDLNDSEEGAVTLSEEDLLSGGALSEGAYILSGDYHNTIEVDAGDRIVHLILDNADIRTNEGPAVLVRSAAKLVITAKEGTQNVLADCAFYTEKNVNAAVFSYSDVTINGTGELQITGFLKDAVNTKGVFKGLDTILRIKAKRNAINADDGMLLKLSGMTAEAEKDGLKTGIHKRISKGNIYILSGENRIIAGNTAILSGRDLFASSCSLSINAVVNGIETGGGSYIDEGVLTQ
ncbi:MAG: carbohydrate-binding domain-containing protein [Lachnospiraceae bacterium]|nr:carbohydrate-binding domain-containing protein [Lachnospiraceae bacterium]